MNERIEELAKDCWDYYEGTLDGNIREFDYEKFAEFIIKDCVNVAHCNFHVDGLTMGVLIKEHFGVDP